VPAWVGWLLANAKRVRRSWGCGRVRAAAAPASSHQQVTTRKNKSFQDEFARYATINTKKTTWCGILRFSKTTLECQTPPKNLNASKGQGEKLIGNIYMLPMSSNYVNNLLLLLSSRLIGSICYNKPGD
jgi:hypothetical protein